MKSMWRMYCTIIVALVLSGVSLVPVSAMEANPLPSGSEQDTELTIPNDYGITVKKLPNSPGGMTAVSSTPGKNANPVVNAAMTKMQANSMELSSTDTARYEIAIPDSALAQLNAESASLSTDVGSELTDKLQAEHPEDFAQLARWSESTQNNVRHENGMTISQMEMTSLTFTNQQSQESRDAVVLQTLDSAGNPVGATMVFSDPEHYQDNAVSTAAQSVVPEEQKNLFKKYSSACTGWKAGFWALVSFITVVAIAALIIAIYATCVLTGLILNELFDTQFLYGTIWYSLIYYNLLFWDSFLDIGLVGVLVILFSLGTSGGAITANVIGVSWMFIKMKDTCAQKEEYGAYKLDPAKKDALPTSMRIDWNLQNNYRSIGWQNYEDTVSYDPHTSSYTVTSYDTATSYTGMQALPAGGYIASGFVKETIIEVELISGQLLNLSEGIYGQVTMFDSAGHVVKNIKIGKDHITVIGDTDDNYGFVSGTLATDGTRYAARTWDPWDLTKTRFQGYIAALNPDGTDHPVLAWANHSYLNISTSPDSKFDAFTRIRATRDNGLIIAGSTTVPKDSYYSNGWLLKLRANGSQEWSKTAGTDSTGFTGVQETPAGGYITAGISQKSIWVDRVADLFSSDRTKVGPAGFVMTWSPDSTKTGETKFDNIWDVAISNIQLASDGGYIISGYGRINGGPIAGAHGMKDAWVAKLRPDLSIEWQKTLGGTKETCLPQLSKHRMEMSLLSVTQSPVIIPLPAGMPTGLHPAGLLTYGTIHP